MDFYDLELCGLERKLPIVPLGPKLSIASFNLLGDGELVSAASRGLARKLKNSTFDYLVGPEVKVVPLLHQLSQLLGKKRYVICRKQIHGYMVEPTSTGRKPSLVLDGPDAKLLKGRKVVVVDDVVSTGRTLKIVDQLMQDAGAQTVARATVLVQGERYLEEFEDLIFLGRLPLFRKLGA